MRTTIELSDHQRAKLLEAAASRGEKGFSGIVQEALEQYFEAREARRKAVERALEAIGTVPDAEAERLDRDFRNLRRSWR